MLITVRELEATLKMIRHYECEQIKRDKISQMLKTRVAQVVRTKKRAARKRAKILQRRILIAQEMLILTGTAPAPVDPSLLLEFEYIMHYLKYNEPIIDDLFQSLSEEELKIIRPYLR